MDERFELFTPRRSKAAWLTLALVIAGGLLAIDLATAERATLIGVYAVPPFIAAVGTGRRATGAVALIAVGLALLAGAWDDQFATFEHLLRVGLVGLAGLFAVRVAGIRERAEMQSRLYSAVARALAESSTLEETGASVIAAIGEALEFDAATLWETGSSTSTLSCTAVWVAPDGRLEQFEELNRRLEPESGIGLAGRVLAPRGRAAPLVRSRRIA